VGYYSAASVFENYDCKKIYIHMQHEKHVLITTTV